MINRILLGVIILLTIYAVVLVKLFVDEENELNYIIIKIENEAKRQFIDKVVTITFYQPIEEQCNEDPFTTASGKVINDSSYYSWCAASRDLMFRYMNFGDTILMYYPELDVYHKYVVWDVMANRWDSRIDVLYPIYYDKHNLPAKGVIKEVISR